MVLPTLSVLVKRQAVFKLQKRALVIYGIPFLSFGSPVEYGADEFSLNVWNHDYKYVKDMDSDGLNDIVIFHDNEVQVFYNETNTSSAPVDTNVQSSEPRTLTDQISASDSIWLENGTDYDKYRDREVADMDGDGKVDVWGLSTEGIKVIWSTTEQ